MMKTGRAFGLLREQLLIDITCSNEGAGHSPSMARDAAPAASVPQVVGPAASFELRDAEVSVTLAVMNAVPVFIMLRKCPATVAAKQSESRTGLQHVRYLILQYEHDHRSGHGDQGEKYRAEGCQSIFLLFGKVYAVAEGIDPCCHYKQYYDKYDQSLSPSLRSIFS